MKACPAVNVLHETLNSHSQDKVRNAHATAGLPLWTAHDAGVPRLHAGGNCNARIVLTGAAGNESGSAGDVEGGVTVVVSSQLPVASGQLIQNEKRHPQGGVFMITN